MSQLSGLGLQVFLIVRIAAALQRNPLDDRHALPFDVAILKSTLFPGRSWVNEKNLAEARDHLIALGVFIRKTSTRREGHMYLVISPDWRHEKGKEFGFGDPDDGASDDEGPDLPGFDHAPSPKPAPANPGRSIGRGKAGSTSKSSAKALRDVSRNRSRPESEADSDTESATRRQSPGKADSATPPPPAPSARSAAMSASARARATSRPARTSPRPGATSPSPPRKWTSPKREKPATKAPNKSSSKAG